MAATEHLCVWGTLIGVYERAGPVIKQFLFCSESREPSAEKLHIVWIYKSLSVCVSICMYMWSKKKEQLLDSIHKVG